MVDRKTRTVYTKTQWQKMLKDYEASGFSVERFCRTRGIGYSTFKRWQHKLQNPSTQNDSFYELRRIEAENEPNTSPISIAFKNGLTLRLQNNADMAKVVEFIRHYQQ